MAYNYLVNRLLCICRLQYLANLAWKRREIFLVFIDFCGVWIVTLDQKLNTYAKIFTENRSHEFKRVAMYFLWFGFPIQFQWKKKHFRYIPMRCKVSVGFVHGRGPNWRNVPSPSSQKGIGFHCVPQFWFKRGFVTVYHWVVSELFLRVFPLWTYCY